MITAIVTDIEGTTSSIDFVHRVLFPYSARVLPEFVRQHAQDAEVAPWLQAVAQECGLPPDALDAIVAVLQEWIAADRKHTALKALQGLIWKAGYAAGAFRSHVYPEVAAVLRRWHAAGWPLYVYSSGSIAAQQQFFAHTEAGDLLPLFSGHFDTTSGGKREVASYERIAAALGRPAAELLFLSDIVEELHAARSAGWNTVLLMRQAEGELPAECEGHPVVRSFEQIDPQQAGHVRR